MDVVVKARHTAVPERVRGHIVEKLAKMDRLDGSVTRIDVEISHEPNPRLADICERVELTCRSRGPAVRAEACADDLYAALDSACTRLEERLRRVHDRRVRRARVTRGAADPRAAGSVPEPVEAGGPDAVPGAGGGTAVPPPGAGPSRSVTAEGEPAVALARQAEDDDGPLLVREKQHASEPMHLDQALHEMELVGHDFFLYWDSETDQPSVVYRRRGYRYGVLRLDQVTAEGANERSVLT